MKFNHHNLGIVSIATPLALLSLFVGNRDLEVGSDTNNYVRAYQHTVECLCFGDRELGFEIFSLLLARTGASPTVFLTVLSLISFFLLIIFSKKMSDHLANERLVPWNLRLAAFAFLVGLVLLSPLTLSTQINGIRQGISAFSLAIVVLEISRNRIFPSIPFLIIAFAFHDSAILYVIPILFFIIIPNNYKLFFGIAIISVSFIFYISGLTRQIVEFVSPSLHQFVTSYGSSAADRLQDGIRRDFALFTMAIIFSMIIICQTINRNGGAYFNRYFTYTIATTIPFFVLGWGYYSNRYLFTTWILIVFFGSSVAAAVLSRLRLVKLTSIVVLALGFTAFSYGFLMS